MNWNFIHTHTHVKKTILFIFDDIFFLHCYNYKLFLLKNKDA